MNTPPFTPLITSYTGRSSTVAQATAADIVISVLGDFIC